MSLTTTEVVAVSAAVFATWHLLRFISSRKSLSHIPGPKAKSWWKGNFDSFMSPDGWAFHQDLYRNYGGVARVDMFYGEQQLSVSDPLALHHILVKDQYIYEETEIFLHTFGVTMGPSLLATQGEVHKRQRKMLNPVFSLKHMRDVLPVLYPISYKLCDILEGEATKGKEYIDVMTWMSRTALENIGQGGFGYSFDALDETRTNKYSEDLKQLLITLNKIDFLRQLLPIAVKLGPPSLRRQLVKLIPSKDVQRLAELTDIIEGHSKNILERKRQALKEGDAAVHAQIGGGKDIMSAIMKTGDSPEPELLAHMNTFIMAAHDTTTSAVSHTLYILSRHQDVQTKLREEILKARREHGDPDYDVLVALPLLDAVCRETLRIHPPATHINRVTNDDVVLPLHWPIKCTDGKKEIKEIPLKKGTTIHISILGANLNKAVWGEDAEEWKPERWLKPLPKTVEDAHLPGVYSQMMTFLGGGRACIGFKFAEMEMKIMLFKLLEKFVFEKGPKISWKMGFVQHPVVTEPGFAPGTVPLKISLVRD